MAPEFLFHSVPLIDCVAGHCCIGCSLEVIPRHIYIYTYRGSCEGLRHHKIKVFGPEGVLYLKTGIEI